jgi:hypothetical protein
MVGSDEAIFNTSYNLKINPKKDYGFCNNSFSDVPVQNSTVCFHFLCEKALFTIAALDHGLNKDCKLALRIFF